MYDFFYFKRIRHKYGNIYHYNKQYNFATTCTKKQSSPLVQCTWSVFLRSSDTTVTLSTHTHTHTCLTALCPGLPGWAGNRKVKLIWILLKQETVSGSGISWAICKSAPRSRQITMPVPHCSVFTGQMPFLPPNQQRQSTELHSATKYIQIISLAEKHTLIK